MPVQPAQQREREFLATSTLTCKRCSWSWYPRRPEPPKVCPKCKRFDWAVERVKS